MLPPRITRFCHQRTTHTVRTRQHSYPERVVSTPMTYNSRLYGKPPIESLDVVSEHHTSSAITPPFDGQKRPRSTHLDRKLKAPRTTYNQYNHSQDVASTYFHVTSTSILMRLNVKLRKL